MDWFETTGETVTVEHVEPSEDLDKFVKQLCKKIQACKDSERRQEFEKECEQGEKQFESELKRKDAGPRDADIDFPLTLEISNQNSTRVVYPLASGANSMFVVQPMDPKYKKAAVKYQRIVDARTDQGDWIRYMSNLAQEAHKKPRGTGKVVWKRKERKVIWTEMQMVDSGEFTMAPNGTMVPMKVEQPVTQEKIIVEDEDAYMEVIRAEDLFYPLPSKDLDTAEWVAHRYPITRNQILKRGQKDEDLWRRDLIEHFDEGLRKLGSREEELDSKERAQESDPKQESEKLTMYEVYTEYEGREVIIDLNLDSEDYIRAVYNWFWEYPRPFIVYCWRERLGEIDGRSLCKTLRHLHVAYSASMCQELDSASRAIEKLIVAMESLGLGEFFKKGRLETGLVEVDATPEEVEKGIREIELAASFTPMDSIKSQIMGHANRVANMTQAFYGEESASRPTARGTLATMEEGKTPLFAELEDFRRAVERTEKIRFARRRQYHPREIQLYTKGVPASYKGDNAVTWEPGYWGEQIAIKTRVTSQTMSVALRKEEMVALIDKLPQVFEIIAQMSQGISPNNPQAAIVAQLLEIYLENVKTMFEELNVEGTDKLNFSAAQQLAQVHQQLQAQVQQLTAQIQGMAAQSGAAQVRQGGAQAAPPGPQVAGAAQVPPQPVVS